MQPETISGIRWALVADGLFELPEAVEFTKDKSAWNSANAYGHRTTHLPNEPIQFLGDHTVQGKLWAASNAVQLVHTLLQRPHFS